MDKKTNLLSNLKKQVMILKSQLEGLENRKSHIQSKHANTSHNKSISHTSRFDSINLDSSYLDRGIKKFPLADSKFKNITEIIN